VKDRNPESSAFSALRRGIVGIELIAHSRFADLPKKHQGPAKKPGLDAKAMTP